MLYDFLGLDRKEHWIEDVSYQEYQHTLASP